MSLSHCDSDSVGQPRRACPALPFSSFPVIPRSSPLQIGAAHVIAQSVRPLRLEPRCHLLLSRHRSDMVLPFGDKSLCFFPKNRDTISATVCCATTNVIFIGFQVGSSSLSGSGWFIWETVFLGYRCVGALISKFKTGGSKTCTQQ